MPRLQFVFFICAVITFYHTHAQTKKISPAALRDQFLHPPAAAKPWTFWYWLQASVSREGITRDLEAMKAAGLEGAYLMPIKGANPSYIEHPVVQLTPEWWAMVKWAMQEARRLRFKLAMHVSDGFALAGGPWITPALSMQKIVWSRQQVSSGQSYHDTLPQPPTNEGYYKDIAVFAYPSPVGTGTSTQTSIPVVTSSKADTNLQRLVMPGNRVNFSSDEPCWIQYAFSQPFTCRSIVVRSRTNYQSNRLVVEGSDDGKNFRPVCRLEPPRSGWQDGDADYTHSIPPTTARYFRFVYSKEGSEPGAEDLDAAKWKPALKLTGIELLGEPRIHGYEGKNGEVWRISRRTDPGQVPRELCVPLKEIIDISKHLDAGGKLHWTAPPGNWTIIRIGATSTGHRNDTGGGGKGLECDKFNPAAVALQFDKWYGEAFRQAGPRLAKVLGMFHVDSWECGSQNWSPLFRTAFKKRRGYDLYPYLPVMAGIPVESVEVSERFLHDVRQTIAELVDANFYGTLSRLAHAKGVQFSAESVAPTMLSDGLLHYSRADVPMGEFWLRSPTHDKPNDMLDAISGAHLYGKQIVQAEAFTSLRTVWDEHPGMLKTLQDRNYALGINRLVYHVFMHNPWPNRRPGMTLDGIGLFFQRDQTWWKPGRAWVEYAQRCQTLLQIGRPVVDVAIFTGEELPRRAVLPDRLVPVLPGIFGKEKVAQEAKRLANKGEPLRTLPVGVTASANITDLEDWTDPLHGYAYDSFNPDALLRLATVRNGRVELPGGVSYGLLVFPGAARMDPDGKMSNGVREKLRQLTGEGATVLFNNVPDPGPDLHGYGEKRAVQKTGLQTSYSNLSQIKRTTGKGRILTGPYTDSTFDKLGLQRDFIARGASGNREEGIAWTHRTAPGLDIYFISNQQELQKACTLSLRVSGRVPELWNPVTGEMVTAKTWRTERGRTELPVQLPPNGSLFIVLQQPAKISAQNGGNNLVEPKPVQAIEGAWTVQFDTALGGPLQPVRFTALTDWSVHQDSAIRYYSGTAVYATTFYWKGIQDHSSVSLNLGRVANIAEVLVNGIPCGIVWTPPYAVDITRALRTGENKVTIGVTNTWANRIAGDQRLPEGERVTMTNAPYRLEGKPLLPAGLLGPVVIEK